MCTVILRVMKWSMIEWNVCTIADVHGVTMPHDGAASYVVVVVKVYVGAYLIVTIISYLQVNSLLLFTSHNTIALICYAPHV